MTKDELFRRLLERTRHNAATVDREISAALEVTGAVLVCDSSGFTATTRRRGILHFLSLLIQSYALSIPLVATHRGTLIKNEADNLIAVFDRPDDAVRCAVAMQDAHRRRNATVDDEDERFYVCMGIDYGRYLRLADDVFGDAVNLAYKLGEDLAGRGEILVTEPVARAVGDAARTVALGTAAAGHVPLAVYRLEW
ncbi:MAG: adenylate/guanylate cyclase domain-containing protein [Gemmatimonadales bacterium]